MENCPCGSGRDFKSCCEPLIMGKMDAPTAEALMRSRYTAYVKGSVDYIEATHKREAQDSVSREETAKWSRESTWHGLKIVSTEKGGIADDWGKVEFIASYSQGGRKEDHHEISEFKKTGGRWYYDTGKFVATTIVRDQPKVGRNEACPCGSGKKYKHCHGA